MIAYVRTWSWSRCQGCRREMLVETREACVCRDCAEAAKQLAEYGWLDWLAVVVGVVALVLA